MVTFIPTHGKNSKIKHNRLEMCPEDTDAPAGECHSIMVKSPGGN